MLRLRLRQKLEIQNFKRGIQTGRMAQESRGMPQRARKSRGARFIRLNRGRFSIYKPLTYYMRFDILTIFPHAFDSYFNESMIKRAKARGLIKIFVHDIRKFSKNKHKKVDDIPYGGGPGMIMTPQPIYDTVRHVKKYNKGPVILLSPSGKLFTHKKARQLAKNKGLILICGRYEGVDERVKKLCVDEEISIGEYVLTGGEIPAMVILDAVSRFIPKFLGKKSSLHEESFSESLDGKKEYPQYTRPPVFKDLKVPKVLQSGHHKNISDWRKKHLR